MKKIRISHEDPRKREKLDELIRDMRRAFSNPSAFTDVEYVSSDDGIYLTITAMTEPAEKTPEPPAQKGPKVKWRKPESDAATPEKSKDRSSKGHIADGGKKVSSAPPAVAEAVTDAGSSEASID